MRHGKVKKLLFGPKTTESYYKIKRAFGDFFSKCVISIVMSNHFAVSNS